MERATENEIIIIEDEESAVRYADWEPGVSTTQHSKCWAICTRPLGGLGKVSRHRPAIPIRFVAMEIVGDIAGFILIGGKSRRMGTDKSQLVLDGQSFVERIAGELSVVTRSVTIVGGNDDARVSADKLLTGSPALETRNSKLEALRKVADVYPEWGALGGVHAALSAWVNVWALIVACDFPFVTRELFARLASLAEDFEAVAPIQRDKIPQPLCALYRVEPCLRRAEQFIKSGERKPIALLQSVHTRWVSFDELRDLEGADHFFDNINTPEDYARVSKKGISTDDAAVS